MERTIAKKISAGLAAAVAVALPLLLWGCGGASSSSSADGDGGTRVTVSLSSAAPFEGLSASREASAAAPASKGNGYDHVWLTVYRVALLPGGGGSPSVPDPEGEEAVYDGEGDPGGISPSLSGELVPPVTVDLLHLPGPDGALLLDTIPSVPAGRYGKIRLYYRDPVVRRAGGSDNVSLSPTAHYHLDLHFTGEGLVLPEGTDGHVRVARLAVTFSLGNRGLKVVEAGKRLHLRPQAFCSVTSLEYGAPPEDLPPLPGPVIPPAPEPDPAPASVPVLLQGVAGDVDGAALAGTVVTPSGNAVPFAWDDGTTWSWVDNDFSPSRIVAPPPDSASASLQPGALVTVIGTVSPSGAVRASSVSLTFPAKRSGSVVPLDPFDLSLFTLSPSGLQVSPAPSLLDARYDDGNGLADPMGYERVLPAANLVVRGYEYNGTISAWWITFGG